MEVTSPCTRQATELGPYSPSGLRTTGLSPLSGSLKMRTTRWAIARRTGSVSEEEERASG